MSVIYYSECIANRARVRVCVCVCSRVCVFACEYGARNIFRTTNTHREEIDDQKVRVQLLVCRARARPCVCVCACVCGVTGWPLIKLKLGICQPPKSHAHFYNQSLSRKTAERTLRTSTGAHART